MAVKSNLEKVYKVKSQNGYYLFKLNSLISKSGRSKNSIKNEKDIDFNSMQRMIKGLLRDWIWISSLSYVMCLTAESKI